MGRNLHEAQTLSRVAEASAGQLALGFNYRHYPAVLRARQLIDSGMIGRPLLARMVLGHGGRPGYEREWKLQRERAGGGALLDPGIHLIDLAQYFLGELRSESVQLQRLYWQTDVEDLATVVLTPLSGGTVVIQSSLLEWKSTFHIELQGSDGYLKINGRMGTYGEQSLAFGRRWAWLNGQSQAEQEELETFGTEDTSFRSQLESVVTALRSGERVPVGLTAGLSTMTIIHDLYDLAGTPEAVQGVAR
jgi:predicted dehydrogenase